MIRWKITGLIATAIIVLSVPLYVLRMNYITQYLKENGSVGKNSFAGSIKCMDCHKTEYDKWIDSHHDHAMDIAGNKTVLGDFNDAQIESHGVNSRFYSREGKYFVRTQGPDGEMGEFEITHTFGWYPLQQYLVPFPGGRLQCLPIAWDDREKRWYHLYTENIIDPGDWLYWTNSGQNWNGMCAECHSTNLKKSYNIETDTYNTTWTDIDVGCEACHGPGSGHVEWAEMPDMARTPVENYNLDVKISGIGSRELVELCAPCHSRRAILGDYTHAEKDLMDSLLPRLLEPELYYPDGQILEEVYIYGSFTQSKMYHRDVRCSDCHDVHSVKLLKEGNELCLQCHRAGTYDTWEHHFHKKKGEKGDPIISDDGNILFDVGSGSECVQCHMPGRIYMGIDYRPDHSLRIPRPDLSEKINVPNGCNRCHFDKTAGWSDDYITRWYGPGRRHHYGTIIEAGRKNVPGSDKDLISLAADPLYPVIVRATALSLLKNYQGEEISRACKIALMDDEALIRHTAVECLDFLDSGQKGKVLSPLLYDPVKAVRIKAASELAGKASEYLDPDQKKVFKSALREFVASMEYSGDFVFGRYNLGNLYVLLNQNEKAIENFKAAFKIDTFFYPAKVNLAMFYDKLGDKEKSEILLREVVSENPGLYDIDYSLALLLVERKQYDEALVYMEKAAKNMQMSSRVHYNLGLLLQFLKRENESEAALLKALELEPRNIDYLYALTDHYLKRGKYSEGKKTAEKIVNTYPKNNLGYDLLNYLKKKPD